MTLQRASSFYTAVAKKKRKSIYKYNKAHNQTSSWKQQSVQVTQHSWMLTGHHYISRTILCTLAITESLSPFTAEKAHLLICLKVWQLWCSQGSHIITHKRVSDHQVLTVKTCLRDQLWDWANGDQLRGWANGDQLRGWAKGGQLRDWAKGGQLRGWANGGQLRGWAKGGQLRGWANGDQLRGWAKGGQLRGWANGGQLWDWANGGQLWDWANGDQLWDWAKGGQLWDWAIRGQLWDWANGDQLRDWAIRGRLWDWANGGGIMGWLTDRALQSGVNPAIRLDRLDRPGLDDFKAL